MNTPTVIDNAQRNKLLAEDDDDGSVANMTEMRQNINRSLVVGDVGDIDVDDDGSNNAYSYADIACAPVKKILANVGYWSMFTTIGNPIIIVAKRRGKSDHIFEAAAEELFFCGTTSDAGRWSLLLLVVCEVVVGTSSLRLSI